MEPNYLIILYSKYSQQCKDIMAILSGNSIPYMKPVCIDNKSMRERLYKSNRIAVKTVPCILMVYPDNKLEKLEGPQVYNWIMRQIQQEIPQPQQPIRDQELDPRSMQVMQPIVEEHPVLDIASKPPEVPVSQIIPIQHAGMLANQQMQEQIIQKQQTPETIPQQLLPPQQFPRENIVKAAEKMAREREEADRDARKNAGRA